MEEKLIQGWRRSKNKMPDVFESSVNWFAHDLASIGDKTFKLEKNSLLLEPESLEHLYSCYDNITNIIYKKYVEPNKLEIFYLKVGYFYIIRLRFTWVPISIA